MIVHESHLHDEICDSKLRRISTCSLTRCKPTLRRTQRAPQERELGAPQCFPSTTTSSESSREDQCRLRELGIAADSDEAPLFRPYDTKAGTGSTGGEATAESLLEEEQARLADARDPSAVSTSALKPLLEGRVLRKMNKADINDVVCLAFEEYYDCPAEFGLNTRTGVDNLDGLFSLLEAMWRNAILNQRFEEADVQKLTDW